MVECPQWRLRSPHYLNSPGITWEQTEVSRETGRQARKSHVVPLLIDPADPSQCNGDGDCVVYHSVEGARAPKRATEFLGDPTPEMEPMNDAAQAISDSLESRWSKSFETFDITNSGEQYSEALVRGLEKALSEAIKNAGGVPQATNQVVVDRDEFESLKAKVAELTAAMPAKSEANRRV